MIKDPEMQRSLAQMSGIGTRVSGDVVKDYRLIYQLKEQLRKNDKKYLIEKEKAHLGLTYLLLFHPSPLVRHEAAFVLGEYGRGYNSFLNDSAFLDSEAIVRHEACLAMSTPSQKAFASRNQWVLEYITRHDRSQMVRDTARVSLDTIEAYL